MKIDGIRFNQPEEDVLRDLAKSAAGASQLVANVRTFYPGALEDKDWRTFEEKLHECGIAVTSNRNSIFTPEGKPKGVLEVQLNPLLDALEDNGNGPDSHLALDDADSDIEILEEGPSGLFGKVYRARQKKLDRIVAIKIIKPEWNNRADVISHALKLAKVDKHPNIVTVHDVQNVTVPGVGSKLPAIVMEWLEGETLGERLAGPRFSIQEVRRICSGIVDGVEYMHEEGIPHGDLHPGNVILQTDCMPRIIDIAASDDRSLAKLSTISRNGAVGSDVDYCRNIVQRVFLHSTLLPSVVTLLDKELGPVQSLAEIRLAIEPYMRPDGQRRPRSRTATTLLATPEAIVEQVQRFIEEDKPASLHSLIKGQLQLLCEELPSDRFSVTSEIDADSIRQRVKDYEDIVLPLASGLAVGCFWGNPQHARLWGECIESITNVYEETESWGGKAISLELRMYPAVVLLYSAGMGAFLNEKYGTLKYLLRNLERIHMQRKESLVTEAWHWKARASDLWNKHVLHEGNRYTPVSDHLENITFEALGGLTTLRKQFEIQFDRFEYFTGLIEAYGDGQSVDSESSWGPVGAFLWRCKAPEDYPGSYFLAESQSQGNGWLPFQAGLFNGRIEHFEKAVAAFDNHVEAVRGQLHVW